MANKQINDLTLRSDFDDTCNLPADDPSQTWRVTGAQMLAYIKASLFADASLITGQSADTAPQSVDSLLSYDLTATALKKVTKADFMKKQITAITTTASLGVETDIATCVAAADYTITLPTAVGIAGKEYIVQRTDAVDGFTITLDGNGSETVGGVAAVTLCTPGETWRIVSDGANWLVLAHRCVTDPVAYTPTVQGFGTLASNTIKSYRDGAFLIIDGTITIGTPSSSEARLNLGFGGTSSNVVAATLGASRHCGEYFHNHTDSVKGGPLMIATGSGFLNFSKEGVFGGNSVNAIGDFAIGTATNGSTAGTIMSIKARVPIANWMA